MKKYAIIVAGGNGRRMVSEVPKQFHLLDGKPVLLHSLETFAKVFPALEIILVIPQGHIPTWEAILKRYPVGILHTIVTGGSTRFQSVKNGLGHVTAPGLVAVHDGVRPLVTEAFIVRLFAEAEKFGCAVPVIHINDTVRQLTGESSRVINRDNLLLVQTPEIFNSDTLKRAFESPELVSFTDVTSVTESMGYTGVHLCEGEAENIKLTRPLDFLIAEAILKNRSQAKS